MTKNEIILKITGREFNIHQSWYIEYRTLIYTLSANEGYRSGLRFTVSHRIDVGELFLCKDPDYAMGEIENKSYESLFKKMKEEGAL